MKVSFYSGKGGCGKTPLSICLMIDKEYAFASNESYDVMTGKIDDSRLLFVASEDEVPSFTSDIDIVFDLAGTMTSSDYSVVSALKQSDVVVVPIYNDEGALKAGMKAIHAAHKLGKTVIVAATKLEKKTSQGWEESNDYLTIRNVVGSIKQDIGYMPAVMPLRLSKLFKKVISDCTSIRELSSRSALSRKQQSDLVAQLDALYREIEKHG